MQARHHDFSAEGPSPVPPLVTPWEKGSSSADPRDGNKYLHARYFDPKIGSFLSPDRSHPAQLGVGTNRFLYGFGNPINLTDRLGRMVSCGNSLGNPYTQNKFVNSPNTDPDKLHFTDSVTVEGKGPDIPDCTVFDNGPLTWVDMFYLFSGLDWTSRRRTPDKPENNTCNPGDLGCEAPAPTGTGEGNSDETTRTGTTTTTGSGSTGGDARRGGGADTTYPGVVNLPLGASYVSLSVNIGIPKTLGILAVSPQLTFAQNGKWYFGLGASAGKTFGTPSSASLTLGWAPQSRLKEGATLDDFLRGSTWNWGAGYLAGGGQSWNGNGSANEAGAFLPPSGGAAWHWSWAVWPW
jgi:RHS repeat-associated protein